MAGVARLERATSGTKTRRSTTELHPSKMVEIFIHLIDYYIGMEGVEPPISCSQSMRRTRLGHIPFCQFMAGEEGVEPTTF